MYSYQSLTSLAGQRIEMQPLRLEDLRPLAQALVSPTTWFSATRDMGTEEKFIDYFSGMISERQDKGLSLTLIARDRETKEITGMSTFQNASAGFGRIEIGFTWIADKWQRTHVNSEMKLLMLTHAFEEMKAARVEFSVHPTNEKSNRAMQRLGAKLEGTLRKWRFIAGADDGDRNIYGIIDDEWPEVRSRLSALLKRSNIS